MNLNPLLNALKAKFPALRLRLHPPFTREWCHRMCHDRVIGDATRLTNQLSTDPTLTPDGIIEPYLQQVQPFLDADLSSRVRSSAIGVARTYARSGCLDPEAIANEALLRLCSVLENDPSRYPPEMDPIVFNKVILVFNRHAALNQRRSIRRQQKRDVPLSSDYVPPGAAEKYFRWHKFKDDLDVALARLERVLNEKEGQVLRLLRQGMRDNREIANELGLTVARVHVIRYWIRKKFHRFWPPRD